MSDACWFSTKVRVVCLIEPQGADGYMDSVYVFRAVGYDSAFLRAVELGRSAEEEYLNIDGHRVRWRLKEIVSLDVIRSESLDRTAVWSGPVDLAPGESIPFNAEFHPERSDPTTTI